MSDPVTRLRSYLEELASAAGALALDHFGRAKMERKGSSIVSEADRDVERLVVSRLRTRFPGDYILAEESGANGPMHPGPGTRWWAVDPIDGTGPYLSRLPFWSVSVACLTGPRVTAAVVHMPALGEMFSAEAGSGAFRNGKPLSPLGQGLPGEHAYLFVPCKEVDGLRIEFPGRKLSLAAASLHFAYAAAGSAFGVVVEPNCAYDVAAASLIWEMAGGAVRYASGAEMDFSVLADGRRMPEPAVAAPAEQLGWLRARVSWAGA